MNELEKRVGRSLNTMSAKLSYLNESVQNLRESFREFNEDMLDYIAYSSEQYKNHEQRISELERKFK